MTTRNSNTPANMCESCGALHDANTALCPACDKRERDEYWADFERDVMEDHADIMFGHPMECFRNDDE